MRNRLGTVMAATLSLGIATGTTPAPGWRLLRSSHFEENRNHNPRLAPNNAWSVCKLADGTVHVAFTEQDGSGVDNVYYRRSVTDGRTWASRTLISAGDSARDAAIACVGDYVGIAWHDWDDGDDHIRYSQSENSGVSWEAILTPSEQDDPGDHEWSMLPSMSMGTKAGHQYANIVFVDSSFLNGTHGAGDFWETHISHRRVDMDEEEEGELYPTDGPHAVSDSSVRIPLFPSVCQERDGKYARCAWLDSLGPDTSLQLFYQKVDGNAGPEGNERVTENITHDHIRPSIQQMFLEELGEGEEEDTLVVAYQYDHPELSRWTIQLARKACNAQASWVHSEPFYFWRADYNEFYRPNLWSEGDTLYAVFTHEFDGLDEKNICFSHSLDYGASWSRPKYVTRCQTDSASVWGDGRDAYVVCNRAFDLDGAERRECRFFRLYYQDYRIPEVVAQDGIGGGSRRLLQVVRSARTLAYRTYVMEEPECFVAVDWTLDNGETWDDIGSPGYGSNPAMATDEDSALCVVFSCNDTRYAAWWNTPLIRRDWTPPVVLFEGSSTVVPGTPSVMLYPGQTYDLKVAAITFPVHDSAAGTSRIMFAKVDTGNVVLDTVESYASLGDSFPCINVYCSDSVYITWQHGDSVVSSYMTGYEVGDWTQPCSTWSTPDVICEDGSGPMSQLECDYLRTVWREERPQMFGPLEYAIATASMDLGAEVYQGWNLESDPSEEDTRDKYGPVYAGAGVTVWQEQVSGVWNIMGEVRGDTVTLFESDTNSLYPHAVAESSAVSPSVSQVRVKLMWAEEVVTDTCELRFVVDSLNVSNAGADATADNNGTKLMRKAGSDSLFAVYTDADGATIYAWSATGDSWARSVYGQSRGSPAIAEDGTGRRWVVSLSVDDGASQNVQARYRCGDTWSTPQTLYTWSTSDGTMSSLSLAGGTDNSTPCAYAAFVFSGYSIFLPPPPELVVAKFDGTNLAVDSAVSGSMSFPCVAAEPGASGDYISLAWQEGDEVYYTRSSYEVPGGDWADTLGWETEVNLSNTAGTNSRHPVLAADDERVAVAWAEGSTPDVLVCCRSTDSTYDNWPDTVNVSGTASASDYPVISLTDSLVVVWEEHIGGTDYDIYASVEYGDTVCLANTETEAVYPHAVYYEKSSGDSTIPYINAVWCETPSSNYYEVRYVKFNLKQASGGGQQSGGELIQPMLYACRPNPFTGRTAIRYQFPREGRVRLQVFDVTGRAVRTLQDGVQRPGIYTLNWDGQDDAGRSVANGIYFYHLTTPGFEDVKKAVVMR